MKAKNELNEIIKNLAQANLDLAAALAENNSSLITHYSNLVTFYTNAQPVAEVHLSEQCQLVKDKKDAIQALTDIMGAAEAHQCLLDRGVVQGPQSIIIML